MRAKVAVAVAVAFLAAALLTGSAQAAKPAEQACLGHFFSSSAKAAGGVGGDVSFFAQNPEVADIQNLGEGIQNLQAGEAPLFPQVCNSD